MSGVGWPSDIPLPVRYAAVVADARAKMITAVRRLQQATDAVDAARRRRDEALVERYTELLDEGLGRSAALQRMRGELASAFTDVELRQLGVSDSTIINAWRYGR